MNKTLDGALRFMNVLHEFRKVERMVLSNGTDRKENDVEHSFNLAMLAWYLNQTLDLQLDETKLFKYSLAHDLVEVYAGDTYFFLEEEAKKDKHEREEKAAKQIKEEFPEFKELHNIIEDYENKINKEAKFIYALDKVEPLLSIYLDKGVTWRKNKVTYEMLTAGKAPKVAVDPVVNDIFQELTKRFKENIEYFTDG
jgi:putative hydrolases of HD superfamily